MPIQVFGQGAVQTAYVGYNKLDLSTIPVGTNKIILVWPTSYVNAPYEDPVTHQLYEIAAAAMDVNTTNPNTNFIQLPEATQVSVGTNFTVQNVGAANFFIKAADGTTNLQTAVPTIRYWFLLTDNSTTNGTWEIVTFGAGTSQASAAALAGYGLYASLNNKLNTYVKVFNLVTPPILDITYSSSIIIWEYTVPASTPINLPDVTTVPQGYYLSFNNQGGGPIVLTPSGGSTIDSSPDLSVDVEQTLTVISDGTNWWTLGFGIGQTAPFTVYSQDVSGSSNIFLTRENSSNDVLNFTGVITANITIGIFFLRRGWIVNNNTTGSFTLSVQLTDGLGGLFGTAFVIPQGTSQTFYSNILSLFSYPTSLNSLTVNGGNITVNNNSLNINNGNENLNSSNLNIMNGQILTQDGSSTIPPYSFTSSTNTGMFYSPGSPAVITSIQGVKAGAFQISAGVSGGVIAISPGNISLQMVSSDTSSQIAYNSNIAINISLAGVVTLPTAPLPINSGGTNATTKAQAAKNILPTAISAGTTLYYDGTNWVILAPPIVGGAADAYLKITKATGVPFWSDT
jgi:hypothetical protein